MAGLGRKVFNSGDILLASEVQGFLQDQAVMVFDDAATRATAIGTANFSEGMVTYTKDDDAIQVFDGTSFVAVGSEPGLVHINSTSFSAVATQDVLDVFTATYDNYLILVKAFGSSTGTSVQARLGVSSSFDASSNYSFAYNGFTRGNTNSNDAGNAQTSWKISANTATGSTKFLTTSMTIFNPFLTQATSYVLQTWSIEQMLARSGGGTHNLDTSYTDLRLFASTGTISGNLKIYGVQN